AAIKVADISVDDDGVSPVSLTLDGVDQDNFEIIGNELFLKAGTVLDFEIKSSFDVTVTATDAVGNTTSAPLGALVTDVNEAPELVGTLGDQTVTAGGTIDVSAISATDPDASDTTTLVIRLQDGSNAPAGITIADGEVSVASDVAAGDYALEILAVDTSQAESVLTVPFSLTVEDAVAAPIGNGPGDDLDQDGTINSDDDDIDGDGALNGVETFRYDATNAGTALAAGESVRLEFDTDGTPFENGFTGALVRPNELPNDGGAEEVNLDNADVSGGTLNITATTGDHFSADGNSQQNAFVAAYSSENGLSVETRFKIPDYNPTLEGEQGPGNFQASGVVIGVDQNTLVKAVYGRAGAEIELAQDATNANNGNGSGPSAGSTPAGAEEVSIRLEVFNDPEIGAIATAFYTFYDINGDVIGDADQEVGPITLVDTPSQGNNLKTLVESGSPLGAGVIQTSTGGQSPPSFDVSYQYVEVTGLEPLPVVLTVTDAPTLVENGDIDPTTLLFPIEASDPAFSGDVTITYDQDGQIGVTQLVTFTAGVGTLSVDVPSDDADNGSEIVSITLTGADDGTTVFEIDAVDFAASGLVIEDDGTNPNDLDEDGILNTDDPFAYDPDNGDAKVLSPGAEFTQDFNIDTTNPFSDEAGFTGILVNPAFDYGNPADPAADPYGNRTNEADVDVSGGTLNVLST
ncbi:MAG: hypothetical protein AAF449_19390, partial [Myxococcota bacterium]